MINERQGGWKVISKNNSILDSRAYRATRYFRDALQERLANGREDMYVPGKSAWRVSSRRSDYRARIIKFNKKFFNNGKYDNQTSETQSYPVQPRLYGFSLDDKGRLQAQDIGGD